MGAYSAWASRLAARTSPRPLPTNAGYVGHQFQHTGHPGTYLLRRGLPAGTGGRCGGAGQVGEVGLLGLVEVQGPGEGVEDPLGGADQVAPFELGTVLDADPARSATSLRRSPGTRRLQLALVSPACSGVIQARRELRKAFTSSRLSTL